MFARRLCSIILFCLAQLALFVWPTRALVPSNALIAPSTHGSSPHVSSPAFPYPTPPLRSFPPYVAPTTKAPFPEGLGRGSNHTGPPPLGVADPVWQQDPRPLGESPATLGPPVVSVN